MKCEFCGEELKGGAERFCSKSCRRRAEFCQELFNRRVEISSTAKKCEYCGKAFIPSNGRHKYCSEACRRANNRRVTTTGDPRKCECCGKEFTPTPGHYQKYCSAQCQKKKTSHDSYERHKRERTCVQCGRVFERKAHAGAQYYCSVECREAAYKEHVRLGLPWRRIHCEKCGELFRVTEFGVRTCEKCRGIVRKTLEEWQREADECGMDYGNYRAQIEVFGKTFEQLKEQSGRYQNHSHIHAR